MEESFESKKHESGEEVCQRGYCPQSESVAESSAMMCGQLFLDYGLTMINVQQKTSDLHSTTTTTTTTTATVIYYVQFFIIQ